MAQLTDTGVDDALARQGSQGLSEQLAQRLAESIGLRGWGGGATA